VKLSAIANEKLLDDVDLRQTLEYTKIAMQEVTDLLTNALETENRINIVREDYRDVAARGSILYFLIAEMALVNSMYQTSLLQFLRLFDVSVDNAARSPVAAKRICNIIDHLTVFLCAVVFADDIV